MNQNLKHEHKAMVIKVYLQKNTYKLMSASQAGDVTIIDLRTFKIMHKLPLRQNIENLETLWINYGPINLGPLIFTVKINFF